MDASGQARVALAARVREALNSVVDPCSVAAGAPAGLTEMGLVRAVEVAPGPAGGQHVSVVIAVTHPGCLMAAVFAVRAERAVSELAGVESVDVDVDAGFQWSEEELAEDYRSRLVEVRARRRRGVRERGGSDRVSEGHPSAGPEDRLGERAGSAVSERRSLITRKRRW